MRRWISTLALAAFATRALLACSTNDSNGDADASTVVTDLGACATSDDASAGKFPHSALPTGQACSGATTCHMAIDDCPNDFATNPVGNGLNEYECLCTGGSWSCQLAVQVDDECGDASGGTVDSGVDSTVDAPVDSSADASVDSAFDATLDASIDSPSDAPVDASFAETGSDAH